jgi:CheY-like chemotaxis protein
MQGDREKCLEAGCDDFMTKPIRRPDLLELAARYMRANQTVAQRDGADGVAAAQPGSP